MTNYFGPELVENLKSMVKEVIKPEPEYNTFMKFLAKYTNKVDDEEILVHITNSHGLQLRNDVNFYLDKREESLNNDQQKMAPVLNFMDLSLFKNIDDIIEKVGQLPEEWTVIQITKRFMELDSLKGLSDYSDPGIFLTRFSCGKLSKRVKPYYVKIESRSQADENFMQLMKDLIKIRTKFFTCGGTSRKLKEEYSNTDTGLMKFVYETENYWLKEWRSLLVGRLEDMSLESNTKREVKKAVENFQQKSKQKTRLSAESFDIIYQLTVAAHSLTYKETLKALSYVFNDRTPDRINEFNPLMEDLKRINLKNSCAVKRAGKYPVILIVDNAFELIPWEMIGVLSGQPVCRISSLHVLYALFKYHEPHIVDGYRLINVNVGYSLINPDKDLVQCEKEISKFLNSKMPWIVLEAGSVPDPKILVSKFRQYPVFLYCGHGSGTQYLKSSDLKKSLVRGLVLLFGCSSNIPKSSGGRTPHQNETHTYITNGCPCLIGCIYDITSSDADIACKEIMSSFLPAVQSNGLIEMPAETDVLKGLILGKMACKRYWSKCSFVARGIPCKTFTENVNKNEKS